MSENTINAALRRIGYTGDEMTAHGFRALASTLLNESGKWNADAIERALAHKDGSTTRGAYHRGTHWAERVRMAQWWSDYLDKLRASSRWICADCDHLASIDSRGSAGAALTAMGDVRRLPEHDDRPSEQTARLTAAIPWALEATGHGLVLGKSGNGKKMSTLYTDRGRIKRHIPPLLGTKRVRDLAAADVNRFIRDVTAGKKQLFNRKLVKCVVNRLFEAE